MLLNAGVTVTVGVALLTVSELVAVAELTWTVSVGVRVAFSN
jgi:hypothetical protein